MEGHVALRSMLMGPPLTERDKDVTLTALDLHLESVAELLPRVYGDSDASQHAQMEFKRFLSMPHDHDGALCKRAALLFALGREKEVGAYFVAQEQSVQWQLTDASAGAPAFAKDMRDRVLPFILPRFVRNSCQTPDSFVLLACVLSEMWAGEQLGNYPLACNAGEAAGGVRLSGQ